MQFPGGRSLHVGGISYMEIMRVMSNIGPHDLRVRAARVPVEAQSKQHTS